MTKQQIVVQLVAAKLAYNGVNPWAEQLEEFGAIADMIIEMFPEPSTEIVYNLDIGNKNKVYKPSREAIKAMEERDVLEKANA